jgi:multiple antibiotic resistance protein
VGIPLLAGPGAISAMIIYGREAASWIDTCFLVLAGLFVSLSVWIALRLAGPIRHLPGRTGINVMIGLFGLILTAIAVEFIAQRLTLLFPGLALG